MKPIRDTTFHADQIMATRVESSLGSTKDKYADSLRTIAGLMVDLIHFTDAAVAAWMAAAPRDRIEFIDTDALARTGDGG